MLGCPPPPIPNFESWGKKFSPYESILHVIFSRILIFFFFFFEKFQVLNVFLIF